MHDEKYISRIKKIGSVLKDYLPGKTFNKNMIQNVIDFYLTNMDIVELEYCRKMVGKSTHIKIERMKDLVELAHANMHKIKLPNAKMKVTGETFSPLLPRSI